MSLRKDVSACVSRWRRFSLACGIIHRAFADCVEGVALEKKSANVSRWREFSLARGIVHRAFADCAAEGVAVEEVSANVSRCCGWGCVFVFREANPLTDCRVRATIIIL